MLQFILEWSAPLPEGTSAEATDGRLLVKLGSSIVWGEGEGGFRWTWIELLEFLSTAWKYLEYEEGDPLGLGVSPSDLRSAARTRWLETPEEMRAGEEETLWAFENTHNLATAVQGAWLPELWLVRQGTQFVLASGRTELREGVSSVLQTLEDLGEEIASRARMVQDERATLAVEAWWSKGAVDSKDFVAVSTGLDEATVEAITGNDEVDRFWGFGDHRKETELLAAARMIGTALSPAEIRNVAEQIRKIAKRDTEQLDQLARAAAAVALGRAPYEQGYEVALWLRERLQLGDRKVDVEGLLADWKVVVLECQLDSPFLDAVCCWGPEHGPAILVNPTGRHARHSYGRRATLAHEICHLLLDRSSSLPLAEVLGGRAPQAVEARAGAFLAELLLPRHVAGQEMVRLDGDPAKIVDRLRRRYEASRKVVCWQAKNSGVKFSEALEKYLAAETARPASSFP